MKVARAKLTQPSRLTKKIRNFWNVKKPNLKKVSLANNRVTVTETEQPFRFTVKFKNFSKMKMRDLTSEGFVDGDHEWRLFIYPEGDDEEGYFSMYLEVANSDTLPDNWSIHVAYSLAIVSNLKSKKRDQDCWFNQDITNDGFPRFLSLGELHDPKRGYLMNDTCVVEVEITDLKYQDQVRARAHTLSKVYACARARAISNDSFGNDSETPEHVTKKRKGRTSDLPTPCESSKKPKDDKTQTLEAAITGEDNLVTINGYKVKAAAAPTLKAVFDKYGDIAANCLFKTLSVKASLLEVICNIVQRLQCSDHDAILSNIEVIEKEVSDVEASNINVAWLHEHLERVHRVAAYRDKSWQKVTIGIVTKLASRELMIRRAELHEAIERFEEAQKCETIMKLVSRKLEDDFMCFEAEESIYKGRLNELL